jgi:hypothetical protein
MHRPRIDYNAVVAAVMICGLLTAGCASDIPDGIEPRNEQGLASLFSNPDTVEVYVFGEVSRTDVRWGRPSNVEDAWLEKHDYVYVRTEYDSLGTETIQEAEEDADADLTDDGETIAGNRVYVRVP